MNAKAAVFLATLLISFSISSPDKPAAAADTPWVASWTASVHGPYPVGNPTAQPELKFAIPSAEAGFTDQTIRNVLRPDVWSNAARIRLSNAFGTKPVTFDDAYVGLQSSGSVVLKGTNTPITFGGKKSVTIAPGQMAVSDPVALNWVKDSNSPMLEGRKLAVSFHVVGETGPISWHAKALQTSYLSGPKSGSVGKQEAEGAFPFSTTSWYFLDAVEMRVPGAKTIVTFGDSITDGTATTLNGDDRWPDVFSRRIHQVAGNKVSVVNEGIGGNMIIGPKDYAAKPFAGGPSALSRLERDIISLPNVSTVIWLEGINDFGNAGAEADAVIDGLKAGVKTLREKIPGVKIFVATLTSSVNSTIGDYGKPEVDKKRRAYNDFVRSAGIFDGVIDFDAATYDAATTEIKAEFQPNSTTGGPGDKLHPNRAGYAAMANAIDLKKILGK